MRTSIILLCFAWQSAICFGQQTNDFKLPDSLSSERIEFVLNLKQDVAEKAWKAFGNKRVEGPIVYYNQEYSEVFFPDRIMKKSLGMENLKTDYIVVPRLDQTPYHFELMVSFEQADKDKYYFDHPVERFIAVEELTKFIPSVQSTELWSSMVIHEMFHHFQYNQSAFYDYATQEIINMGIDIRDLKKLCDQDPDFYKLIKKENDLLLSALKTNNIQEKQNLADAFLKLQSERYDRYKDSYPELEQLERYYILQEGSARYAEYYSLEIFKERSRLSVDDVLNEDPRFLNFKAFSDLSFEHPDFEYLIYPTKDTYHYAIGFNLMRLLDQLNINYKEKVFAQPALGLDSFLK